MNDRDRARIIADEAAQERQYNQGLAQRSIEFRQNLGQMIQNTWTNTVSPEMAAEGRFIGRVSLRSPSSLFDGATNFYIGTKHLDRDDLKVFSWVSEVACTFYRRSANHHELCDEVAGIRILVHRNDRIADFADERVDGAEPGELFPKVQLRVPRAPGRGVQTAEPTSIVGETLPGADAAPKRENEAGSNTPKGVRTPELLRRQLAAPKAKAMSAVLATLQPDQYEMITRPAAADQILQGHPGTGKTIIAAHRVAYMLSTGAPFEARADKKILLLGPTVEYVEHVSAAIRDIIGPTERYEVKAISTLLDELAGLPNSGDPTETVEWEDVSPDLGKLVDMAHSRAFSQLRDVGEKPTSGDVYAELVYLLANPPDEGLDAEWVRYLRRLPKTFNEMKRSGDRGYRGLMAYIGARVSRRQAPGHILVDEAQDIHPIEWAVLGRLGNKGGWTILGDLNQRRTDHTFNTWDEVAELLALENDTGAAPVQVLETGYRSTAQIIRFANQLLPARDRMVFSLQQDGEAPQVRRVHAVGDLREATIGAAMELLGRVGSGTVAVIAVEPHTIVTALRRRGWTADPGDSSTWLSDGRKIRVLPPERARGLEFDAVVVLEPADFPENVGRLGVLYTALTRANRLLAVVHHKALPKGLKVRS